MIPKIRYYTPVGELGPLPTVSCRKSLSCGSNPICTKLSMTTAASEMSSRWNDLAAVRQGRVTLIDGNAYLNRSGPRIVDSLEIVAHAVHPDAFPAPSHSGWKRFFD